MSAVFVAAFPELGIGFVGISLAFDLTVLTMAYVVGHISGGHFNPAVSVSLLVGARFDKKDFLPYVTPQVIGAIAAAVLYLIASGKAGFDAAASGFASNGYAEHSPNDYSLVSALVAEVVLTSFFLIIILGAIDESVPKGFVPIAIGRGLTLIHLISIPIANTSVNPACSTGVAIFQCCWALEQLWLFWVAPIVRAIIGAIIYKIMGCTCGCCKSAK